MLDLLHMLRHSQLWVCLVLGYNSGISLLLSDTTLKVSYSTAEVDIITIGFLSLAGVPCILKFLWAPLLDQFSPRIDGRRRGWLLLFLLAIIITLFAIAIIQKLQQPVCLGLLAVILALFSTSLDSMMDAYRTELLPPKARGMGASFSLWGAVWEH